MADIREDEDVPDTVKIDDLAVTNQRVNTLERSVRDLSEDLSRTSKELSTQIGSVATNLMAELKGVTGQLSERSKIPWQALGVVLTFVTVIGGLVYWPIKDSQSRLETQLLRIAEGAVSQKEFNERWATGAARRDDWQRASEDRSKDNRSLIEKLREALVPRAEHEEKWRGADNKFADLQRQIDKQERAFGDTYSLKDVLARMQRRQDELEAELRTARLAVAAGTKQP